jgi:hypothetical protein
LSAPAIFQLPGAYRTALDAVLLISNDLQWGPAGVGWVQSEAALEEAAGAGVVVVLVLLHGIGLVLLPLPVLFDALSCGQ